MSGHPAWHFDLPHRAGVAINPLATLLDGKQRGLPYFDAHYGTKPPYAVHIRWDCGDCLGRYMDALSLARIMSGSCEGDAADRAIEQWAEGLIGPHGLSWWPVPAYASRHSADSPGCPRLHDRSPTKLTVRLQAPTRCALHAGVGRRSHPAR